MTEKSAKPAASKPTSSRKPTTRRRKLSKRAYFIHIEEGGSDQLGNWVRAERELTAA